MRLIGLALAIACLCATAAISAPAHASSITSIASFDDPRADMPARPGDLKKGMYGPFTIPAADSPSSPGQLHNIPTSEPAPCTGCRITDMVPNLVYADGTPANMDNGVLLHHVVFFNPAQQGIVCGTAEAFTGAGNERTHVHLPTPFGYENTAANWTMLTHLVNLRPFTQTVYMQMVYRHRPLSETQKTRPLWLDVDQCGDSEYTIPTGYSDTHSDWSSTVDARVIDAYGHLHDIDIIDPDPCESHCPERGGGIALSAEVVGGPDTDYYGPSLPPADITGATLCHSVANYGTTFGTANGGAGHLDTAGHCGIFTDLPGTQSALAYPPGGGYPTEGYPIRKNQVIRLHSEYQNDSDVQKTDVMGIMLGWLVFPDPYPRPKAATPLFAPLVPAYNACGTTNRRHAPPLNFNSCTPTAASAQLTTGTPDANAKTANFVGSVKLRVINGDANTTADEADVSYRVDVADVRRRSDLADYTGQLQVNSTLRITDRLNGPGETGTVQNAGFPLTVPCTATTDPAVGSTCSLTTTADSVQPGTVREGRRANWELAPVQVFDGGPDGLASTTPNTLFATQGLFVP